MDKEYDRLSVIRRQTSGDVVQGERDGLLTAALLDLRHLANSAWQAAEAYRKKTGCLLYPTP